MTAGRTTWWPKDAAWHRRERIVLLGEEFGAAGPNTLDVLCAWAQEQRAAGQVRGGFRSLAREAFVDVAEARTIVEHAAKAGALDDLEIDEDGRRFICRVSGWEADQQRGRAAFRKAAQREREAETAQESGNHDGTSHAESGQVTPQRDESRPATPSTPPDLTRPNQKTEPPQPPEGEHEIDLDGDPPERPTKNRQSDLRRYEDDLRAWSEGLLPRAGPDDALHAVRAAMGLVMGHHPTRDEVLAGVRKWRPELLDVEEQAA